MNRNIVEAIMGAVVLGVAFVFIFFAYSKSKWAPVEGYPLVAFFDRIDGLHEGSDVRIGGVKVGAVTQLKVDLESYMAQVTFQVKDTIKLPKDSSAEIVSDGLLGSKYLAIVPGGDDEMLSAGGRIRHTQSSVSLEAMIGKLIFSKNEDPKPSSKEEKGGTPPLETPSREETPSSISDAKKTPE